MGMRKQQQNSTVFFVFGRAILAGRCAFPPPWPVLDRPPCRCCFDFSCATIPRRSASVSRLVRSSSMGVVDVLGPGLDRAERLACSLCCQQYNVSSWGSSTRSPPAFDRGGGFDAAAIGRLHGRPLEVIPLHVVEGSLESDRPIKDSGVLAKNGIVPDRGRGLGAEGSWGAPCWR